MRRLVVVIALAAAALIAGEIQAQDGPESDQPKTDAPKSQATKTVWDGVYTEAQAERGKAAYATSCAMCHGPDLAGGGEAPALAGSTFLTSWNGHAVDELFERTSTTMPLQAPGSLDAAAYADILSYIFKSSGFPAGEAELAHSVEALTGVRIDAAKPAAIGAGGAQTPQK